MCFLVFGFGSYRFYIAKCLDCESIKVILQFPNDKDKDKDNNMDKTENEQKEQKQKKEKRKKNMKKQVKKKKNVFHLIGII